MSAAQGSAAMASVYSILSAVATAAVPPASIVTDPTVGAYYSLAPAAQANPQFFLAVTGVTGAKQIPHYIGAGRLEDFEVSCIAWGGLTDASVPNLEALTAFLFSMVDSVSAAIDADPSLAGVAYQSWLSGYDLTFDVETNGRAAQVDFSIHVDTQVS